MSQRDSKLGKLVFLAVGGLMAGGLVGCKSPDDHSSMEQNSCSAKGGCSGKDGCGGKSGCSGKDGCGGQDA